jgi:deoxyribose-phosphate aldolase
MDLANNHHLTNVDDIGLINRSLFFKKRSIKKDSKVMAIKMAISMLDLTTLEGQDTSGKIFNLCQKAKCPHPDTDLLKDVGLPSPAAVCVYPNFVKEAKAALKATNVKVASVATGFPSGQTPLSIRLEEVRFAVTEGADEIDMVISRGKLLEAEFNHIKEEIIAVKKACGDAKLKVILEVGELSSYSLVKKASFIAMEAGADFIKTSTGKVSVNATMPVSLAMMETIRDFYYFTGKKVGFKPAGGIKTSKDAIHYLCMVRETLGDEWLTPDLFRFGASSLLNDLLRQLVKMHDGIYQGSDYFTIA